VQEVFVSVWEKEKYELERTYLKSYLFNAVRNGCLNYLKHQTIVRKHVDEEHEILKMHELDFYKSGEKSLIEKEDLDKIYSAIDSLSDSYREIIQLSRFEGLKNKKIAEKLGIPVRTVETRLFRALNKLRDVLSSKQILILMQFSFKTHKKISF
jgi:RNA polymerase sigma-70 factor (ECF subfamily)